MIAVNNLSFNYKQKASLFDGFGFNQNSGSIVGLLGKNGAGKSTLLNLLSGLVSPKKGTIQINGFNPIERKPDFLSDIFLITEEPFFPPLTIKAYTVIYASFYENFDLDKMDRILQEFELNPDEKLQNISHGQRKKFIIAFALSTNCKLLLFDEPTNGLDIPSKSIFRKVLVNSIEDHQLVIVSTHQVKDIETIIDKIVILDEGTIVFEKEVNVITEKLQFKKITSIAEPSNVLFSEKCLGGYNAILPVVNNEETNIDIELLFKAIINKTEITL